MFGMTKKSSSFQRPYADIGGKQRLRRDGESKLRFILVLCYLSLILHLASMILDLMLGYSQFIPYLVGLLRISGLSYRECVYSGRIQSRYLSLCTRTSYAPFPRVVTEMGSSSSWTLREIDISTRYKTSEIRGFTLLFEVARKIKMDY
jgi:hypothetical protein